MKLPILIAIRYLFGKKSTNAINIITGISVLGISIGTAALLLILSVFNGFEDLISGFFNSFNPEIKIYPLEGKKIDEDVFPWATLDSLDGIDTYSKTLEELVLFEYDGIQEVGYLKGVDEQFSSVNKIDSTIRRGKFYLDDGKRDFAVLGAGLAGKLNVSIRQSTVPIRIFAPSRKKSIIPGKSYKSLLIFPIGTFAVQSEEDYKYAFSSLAFLRGLLDDKKKLSFVEIKTNEDVSIKTLKEQLQTRLGDHYIIRDKWEQDASFLRVMAIEKWMSYAIACLTLLLIAFNMVGSLWMIVLDKRKDLSILKTMGMLKKEIQRIFIWEGILIAFVGFVLGISLGLLLYYLQKVYGLVPIPEGAIIDAYPAELRIPDIFVVLVTVMLIGFLASLLPAKRAGLVETHFRES